MKQLLGSNEPAQTCNLVRLLHYYIVSKCVVTAHKLIAHETTTEIESQHEISNNVVCATSKGSDQPAQTRSLVRAFANRLNIL